MRIHRGIGSAAAMFIMALAGMAWGEQRFEARVVGVSDGDTITVLDQNNTQHRIRLVGIDTPEKKQAFGMRARQALSDKVFSRIVTVAWKEKDRYGRTLGNIYLEDRWINLELVAEGWAWHYVRYSDDSQLAEAEKRARADRLGLWQDAAPLPPWDFRKLKR